MGAGKKGSTRSSSIGLEVDREVSFDKASVAGKFNYFFVTVASSLVSKLPLGPGRYGLDFVENCYLSRQVKQNAFGLSQVDEDYELKLLMKINTCKSTGLDNLPAKIHQRSCAVDMKPLTHIINLSIMSGDIPSDMKNARVVPIYKKNCKTEVGNYRPVFILSAISKIFKRNVYDQLEKYLKDESLLYEFQSGFQPSFSTDTCLIHLSDYI